MTNRQAEELLVLVRALCKHLKVRVPRESAAPAVESVERPGQVSVIDRTRRGARLVPGSSIHPHERFDGDLPTSTVRSRDAFFERTAD